MLANTHSRSKVGKHLRCRVGNILNMPGWLSLKQQCGEVAELVILFLAGFLSMNLGKSLFFSVHRCPYVKWG